MIIMMYESLVMLRTMAYSFDIFIAAKRNSKVTLYLGCILMDTKNTHRVKYMKQCQGVKLHGVFL
jgi:hypothetical protein